MSNVIGFPASPAARRQMRAEACAWLARLDAGATEADKAALQRWLAQKPEHRQVLLEVAGQWDEMNVLAELSEVFPLKQHEISSSRGRWRLAAAAAVFALTAGSWFMVPRQQEANTAPPGEASVALRYETRIGQQTNVTLGDGSQITLNTNSLAEVVYSESERSIELLRGEAHFMVAKDPARPFRVDAGNGIVEAVGTAFAVQREDNGDVEVTVTEGRVQLSKQQRAPALNAADTRSELVAGERAFITEALAAIEKESVEPMAIEAELAWRHGMLLFQDQPLGDVLREFSRYTPVRIEADEKVLAMLVGGYLPAGDVDRLLSHLQTSLKLQVSYLSDEHIVLSVQ